MPSVTYYLRRFWELGFREGSSQTAEVLTRGASSLWQEFRGRYIRSEWSETAVINLCGFSSTGDLLKHFKSRKRPRFFFDDSLEARLPEFRSRFPHESERIMRNADLVMQHKFDLLGSGYVDLNSDGNLPWHMDFKSGFSWNPETYYKRVRYGDRPGVDIKTAWELSRFQHAITLGQAYRLSKNEACAEEFVRQVLDWIDRNPCAFGVNWSCAMEVGIRAVNWIWAFYLLKDSPAIDEVFLPKFLTSLYNHARFICENLEYREVWIDGRRRRLNSNHYLSDLVGLLYVAMLFPEFKMEKEAVFAASELQTELFEETLADGTDYEHSTYYHRFVLEIFLSGFLLLKLNGTPIDASVVARLERMAEFVADYVREDGSAPQIGDADNGRLHPLSARDVADHTYLPLMAAELFGRDDLRLRDEDPEVWWWLGRSTQTSSRARRKSKGYRDTGFYIMRGDDVHVFISAASVGMLGFGSHSHNDLLSLEYWYKGCPWIVDPGTYVYTPDREARNSFRSTRSHNTVAIDGQEINRFEEHQLFQISGNARVTIHEWTTDAPTDILDAEHDGYMRLSEGVRHRRRFQLDKAAGTLVVQDFFQGSGNHVFEWFFHLHPAVEVQRDGRDFLLECAGQRVKLEPVSETFRAGIIKGVYSPSYGIRKDTNVVVLVLSGVAPLATEIRISPLPATDAC
jgi:hypothetical protein